jgi:hypothetical protein
MKLHTFFLLIISFACTHLEALPARGNQCVPVNTGGGALRNINGYAISAFSDQVRVVVVQSHVEPGTGHPFGGVLVDIFNDHCLPVRVSFTSAIPQLWDRNWVLSPRDRVRDGLVSGQVPQGGIINVRIEEEYY